VSVSGGIRIHRVDCPNAPQLIERFGYRIVPARWEGKSAGAQYAITLLVYGHDDIGIVTNITQVINKEKGTLLRSISIDANDGIFKGQLTIMVDDVKQLDGLIKKVGAIKGVSHVERG
jgi:GTP pyrophosphokinase